MKNKIQKNNEKILDHSTRSRSIKSTWAVRLLVLLVMLTTILASFVVPASAADPFRGSGLFDFEYLISFRNNMGGSTYVELNNPLPADYTLSPSEGFYITDTTFVYEHRGYFPSFEFKFDASSMYANDFANFPFVSCSLDVQAVVNNQTISIPAGENIVDYVKSQGALTGISAIRRLSTAASSSGPHRYEFTLNRDGVSFQFEGGIQSVFDLIGSWLSNTFNTLGGVFFDNGSLTVLGGLAIGSLGVSVILLLIKVISNFIRFRG